MTDVFPGDRVTFHYKGTIVRGVVKKKMVKNVKVTADDGKDWKVTARLLTKEAKKKEDIRICAISAYLEREAGVRLDGDETFEQALKEFRCVESVYTLEEIVELYQRAGPDAFDH